MITTIIFSVMLSLSPARAESVISDITGNFVYSDKEIKNVVDFSLPDDSIRAAIISLYNDIGYFQTTVVSELASGRKRIIRIVEGGPTSIDSLHIDIYPDSLNRFDDLLEETLGRIASKQRLDQIAYEIVSRLAEMGMPFARAEWIDFTIENENNLRAKLKIIPGPFCYVRRFVYQGISRTRPETIDRRMVLKEGNLYSEILADESQRRIERMPFLETIAPFEIALAGKDDSCEVIYYLRELPSTRFDGAAGYARSENRNDFIGRLDLEFGDILGTGRGFGLNWKKKDSRSGELRLSYDEPYLLGSQFDLNLEAYQVDRDTLYIETGGNIRFEYRIGLDLNAAFSFGMRMVEPETDAAISSSTSKSIGLGFEYDNTDYPENPRRGYQLGSEIDYRYRSNRRGVVAGIPLTKITAIGFDGVEYVALFRRIVLALKVSGWGIVNSDGAVAADELQYIGGIDNLRGYIEDRFPAYRYGIATSEIRLLAGKRSRIYLFGDFGAITNSQTNANSYKFQPGYGFGLISPTALGSFKVEIGWGKSGFPSDAVLNFGIAGGF